MNIKQLVMSLGMLTFVGAVVVGGTGAFFSDTEVSENNVFTAGSVSLALTNIEHDYLGDDAAIPENYFQYIANSADPEVGPAYRFNDLKPLDNGTITSTLLNGANDAFVCKRFTAEDGTDEELASMISIRTGTGPGAPMATVFETIGLNQWFAPVAPASGLTSLPLDANEDGDYTIEYCFGEFTPGSALGQGCVLDEDVDDYNIAQNATFAFDVEYYAVQQRNNEEFTCAELNVPDVPTSAGAITSVQAEYVESPAGGPVYTGVYVGFSTIDVTDATAVELRLNLDDGTDYSIFGQTPVLNAVNASPAAYSTGGTVITTGSRTSSSWSPQTGTIGNGRSVVNVEVLITLGDGTVITSTIDEASITGQATQGAAFPS